MNGAYCYGPGAYTKQRGNKAFAQLRTLNYEAKLLKVTIPQVLLAQTILAEEQDRVLVFLPTRGLRASLDLTVAPAAHL